MFQTSNFKQSLCFTATTQVGNGDIVSVSAARQMVSETNCGAIMIGRGAVSDPLLFLRLRAAYERPDLPWEWDEPEVVQAFIRCYAQTCLKPLPAAVSMVPPPDGDGAQEADGFEVRLGGEDGREVLCSTSDQVMDARLAMVSESVCRGRIRSRFTSQNRRLE